MAFYTESICQGFSQECTLKSICKPSVWANDSVHWEHLYDVSQMWPFKCLCKTPDRENNFVQNVSQTFYTAAVWFLLLAITGAAVGLLSRVNSPMPLQFMWLLARLLQCEHEGELGQCTQLCDLSLGFLLQWNMMIFCDLLVLEALSLQNIAMNQGKETLCSYVPIVQKDKFKAGKEKRTSYNWEKSWWLFRHKIIN